MVAVSKSPAASSGCTSSGASGSVSARESVEDAIGATCEACPIVEDADAAFRSSGCNGAVVDVDVAWLFDSKGSGIE
jgi:hypothetical protein